MTKALVTGGSGFVGSNVCEALKRDYEVRVLDVNTPRTQGVEFVRGSIMDSEVSLRSAEGCDVVVHLAAVLGVGRTESNPILTLDVNVQGTRNVLEACRRNNVRKIIFGSSSEVYGEPVTNPIEETDPPMPITMYGTSKLAGEEYVKSFSGTYGTRYTILRFFNLYGPNQSSDFVVPRFVKAALANEAVFVDGDGMQVRSFCYVGDAADAVLATTGGGDGETLNIGNGEEPIAIRDLAAKVIEICGSESAVEFRAFERSGRGGRREILRRIPGTAKARRVISYSPKVSLAEGISKLVRSQRSREER